MKYIDAEKPNAVELAKDIVATLTNFIVFTEPNEVDDDYAERIKKSHELLVYDENAADKKSVKEMMDSLNEKIAKATKSWKGVDVDKFMDEMRGREPDKDLEEAAMNYIAPIENDEGLDYINFNGRDIKDAFIAGAKWMQDQFEKNRLANYDKLTKEEYDRETDFALGIIEEEHRQPTFTDAINYGMRVMKDQMMKEAVEGFFTKSIDGDVVFAESTALDVDPKSVKVGDKVKLIVIKED